MDATTSRTTNRLAGEQSPYLLQHQHNPVDWYPWGDEAWQRAKAEDKPVFLSVGYSTCHWCHVMERESFEDQEVADLLNRHFVSIKVDREERPEIDQAYMEVCQMLTGHGGWPLTVILTPDRLPFFAGTYFPKRSRFGRAGLMDLLPRLAEVWREQREQVTESAAQITQHVRMQQRTAAPAEPDERLLREGFHQLSTAYDDRNGGFGSRPKFPQPHTLYFLLRYWRRTGERRALRMVDDTLRRMRLGGMFDQLGGGFHRYSTDERWFLPHFEKMLYDQALLAIAYLEGYQATGKVQHALTARSVLDYVRGELTGEHGSFYSADDADSEGEEGKFYVWSTAEVRELLPRTQADLIIRTYGLRDEGNFREEATGKRTGDNVLYLADEAAWERLANPSPDLVAAGRTLLAARDKREHPFRDDKVLTDWNGLAIAAMARAAWVLGEPAYARAAEDAARHILGGAVRTPEGKRRLQHRYRNGQWDIPAYLDDYAYLAWGLVELYAATWDPQYLGEAKALVDEAGELFLDGGAAGYYLTANDTPAVLARHRPAYDGATPAGNSVMLQVLLYLARLLGDAALEETAASTAAMLAGEAGGSAWGRTHFLSALDFALGPTAEVVIAGQVDDTVLSKLRQGFEPNLTLMRTPPPGGPDGAEQLSRLAPWTKALAPVDSGKVTIYVCSSGECRLPSGDPAEALSTLESVLARGGADAKSPGTEP